MSSSYFQFMKPTVRYIFAAVTFCGLVVLLNETYDSRSSLPQAQPDDEQPSDGLGLGLIDDVLNSTLGVCSRGTLEAGIYADGLSSKKSSPCLYRNEPITAMD